LASRKKDNLKIFKIPAAAELSTSVLVVVMPYYSRCKR